MRRDIRALIYDVQQSISSVEGYTDGLSFDAYNSNRMVQDATERHFITIGEAVRRMRLLGEDVNTRVQNLTAAADFRNFLVHEYEKVNNKQVWHIVKSSMPALKQQIDAWATELGMEAPPERTT